MSSDNLPPFGRNTLFGLLLTFVTACGGGGGDGVGDVGSVEYVLGWIDCGELSAEASNYSSGADIFIYDAEGALLNDASIAVRSNPSGSFVVPISDVPDTFSVVAENAWCVDAEAAQFKSNGQSFKAAPATSTKPYFVGQLKAEIRDYDPEDDILYINPVTTLLATYLERYPEVTYEEAQSEVKRFLEIPEAVDLAHAPDLAELHFSMAQFLAEVEELGSAESLLEGCMAEMQADPLATHPFYSHAVSESVGFGATGLIDFVAGKLASGALSKVGGEGLGWLLSSIGLNIDPTAQAIEEMKQDLKEIKDMLVNLSALHKAETDKLSKEIAQSDYNTAIRALDNSIISHINEAFEELNSLAEYVDKPEKVPPSEMLRKKNALMGELNSKVCHKFDLIHNNQVGIAGAEGLIRLWSYIVAGQHRFLGPKDSERMRAQFDYFDALQLSQFALCIEYKHANGESEVFLQELVDKYFEHRTAQKAMLPTPIPEKALVETRTRLMISPYTIWEDAPGLHFGYHFACSLPIHNSAPHATVRDYFNATNALPRTFYGEPPACVAPAKSVPLLGFRNWRAATLSEAEEMFVDVPWPANQARWAISQGYPTDCVSQGKKRPCLDESVQMFLTSVPKFYRRPRHPNWDEQVLGRNLKVYLQRMGDGFRAEIKCGINTTRYPRSTSQSWQCATFQGIHGPGGFWQAPKGHLTPIREISWDCALPITPEKECYYYER
jgi:hypothetical protein